MSAKKSGGPLIGDNRKARHIYEYLETIEAGISLTGPEVKSLRAGQVNFTDSYVEFRRGEAWLIGLHIAPYTNAGYVEQNADRPRKLLMHAQEIASFAAKVEQKGLTVVRRSCTSSTGRSRWSWLLDGAASCTITAWN